MTAETARELTGLDAIAQAELVRARQVTPVELVDAAIAQVERLNPGLNAVVHLAAERAREEAAAVDPALPLAGVPLLLKDLVVRRAGFPATDGSRAGAGRVAVRDSELVRRYRAAGLIAIGQTNTAEFGVTPTTESELFGPARNPWDPARTAGGSSGGSAAAVAAGMTPLAHGNDGGGSIRIPASCCGVFGLKPSFGRTPLEPDAGALLCRVLSNHVLTRSVRDSALVLDLTAGRARGSLLDAPPPPAGGWLAAATAPPRGGLRIALSTSPLAAVPVHEECVTAVEQAARLCEELGHHVTEAMPPLDADELTAAWFTLWRELMGSLVAEVARETGVEPSPDGFDALTWEHYLAAREHTAFEHMRALTAIDSAARLLHEFMEGFDAWLTPTLAQPPLVLGEFAAPADRVARYVRFSPFTRLANVSGQPAMSVPLHRSPSGLPIGVHFLGQLGREDVLLSLAGQLERARPWTGRLPA
ncbi:amidase [Conexibacter woesei]|uniref:Amidase n=1 Tax=Conexibacter woesei (strain DSM 14684 / CCUG 47730 / CIP 108061 / JCM 11494 / NBRC 100937 / ID131577) TaxID=469383 RepID=D3F584_CONWI|nr:amidase family protein [Conexibacter woesei]ADB50551.1 Amidase [Conexibacter woesei DSM 14684]